MLTIDRQRTRRRDGQVSELQESPRPHDQRKQSPPSAGVRPREADAPAQGCFHQSATK